MCNAARMSILYKFGGTYIDLDHIVFKDVRLLPTPGLSSVFFYLFSVDGPLFFFSSQASLSNLPPDQTMLL